MRGRGRKNARGMWVSAHGGRQKSNGSQRRIMVLKYGFMLLFVILALRLIQIQIIDSAKYRDLAKKQTEVPVTLPASRGNIYDRIGTLMVTNAIMTSLAADPKMVADDAEEYAGRLARVFDRPRRYYQEKMSTDRHFVWLERRVKPQQAELVHPSDFNGAVQLEEPRRLYHYDDLAGQVIGFTDVDNTGVSGIELQCNAALLGKNGHMILQRDALGRKRASVDYPRVEPTNGKSLCLTIDVGYQAIAEEELRRGIERTSAESGLAILLDPMTGEILAMASVPGVNPNNPSSASPANLRNRCVTDMFEPGSVFKIVTASAALEHHLVSPSQRFGAEHGRYLAPLPRGKSHLITDTHPFDELSFQEAMEQSSNIVLAKVSNAIGSERLYTMARNFGFGTETGIDLPGEIGGLLKKPSQWSGTTLNVMAYGYEVGVTPIQIACAYAAIANGGVLMKPFVVKSILDEEGKEISKTTPQRIRTVVSRETAETLTDFFEGVVLRGTGKGAGFPGTAVAGKTGTSRKFGQSGYEQGNYTASFVGFFPARDPKMVCLVMLDNPKMGGYTGGLASAPIFRGIAQKVFATSGRFARQENSPIAASQYVVPDVSMLPLESARSILAGEGFAVQVEGTGMIVRSQNPAAGSRLGRGQEVTLSARGFSSTLPAGYAQVPDLHGLSMRRAMNRIATEQLSVELSGSGVVASQQPAAGSVVKTGSHIVVRCEPRTVLVVN